MLRGGQRLGQGPLLLPLAANSGSDARLGLIAAKRILPHAVDRNRFKRRARESFRRLRAGLPRYDLVLVARPGAQALVGAAFQAAFGELLARALRRFPPAP